MLRPDGDALRCLMLRSLSGDAAAHKVLLTELSIVLRMHIGRKLRSPPEDVEDLVQEALLAIHLRREHYDPSRPILPWVLAIARYKWIDYLRHQKSIPPISNEDTADVAGADLAEQTCASIDVQNLLARLPQRQREAIETTKIEGLSVDEAAARFGISHSGVKMCVHRGLKALAANVSGALRAYG